MCVDYFWLLVLKKNCLAAKNYTKTAKHLQMSRLLPVVALSENLR